MNGETRVDVFGVDVSLCTVDGISESILSPSHRGRFVAIANVHSVMTARRDTEVASALARADAVTPDGMPLVWALQASGHPEATRVTGIDVMTRALALGVDRGTRHLFYGSTPRVLDALVERVHRDHSGVKVAGSISPPFRPLSPEEVDSHVDRIVDSAADVVWVGMGMPKQELWIRQVVDHLPGVTLIGVGAAFDWYAGLVPRAPQWMQDAGLEWSYRLMRDPRRLWKRYLLNNPGFLLLLAGRAMEGRLGRRS